MRHLLASALRRAAVLAVGLARRIEPHEPIVSYGAVPTGGWSMSVNGAPYRRTEVN